MQLVLLFFIHFIADFILQSREMGQKKSSSWKWLGYHTTIIFLAFVYFGWKFALVNAAIHAIIDRNIWGLYKWSTYYREPNATVHNWKYWEDHLFYVTIGLDQFLHTATIILLAEYLL